MDKINGINALMSVLRNQMTRNAERKSRTTSTPRSACTDPKHKPSVRELDRQIIGKINKLNPDELGFQNKSVRIIVESILAWEFGDNILGDPEFESLVNKVTSNLESSEKLQDLFKDYCHSAS